MNGERPAGASRQCPHSDLHFHLNNASFGNTNIHYLEVKAKCNICDAAMIFRGLPVGLHANHPTASLDRQTVSLPFLADGEELTGDPVGYSLSVIR